MKNKNKKQASSQFIKRKHDQKSFNQEQKKEATSGKRRKKHWTESGRKREKYTRKAKGRRKERICFDLIPNKFIFCFKNLERFLKSFSNNHCVSPEERYCLLTWHTGTLTTKWWSRKISPRKSKVKESQRHHQSWE